MLNMFEELLKTEVFSFSIQFHTYLLVLMVCFYRQSALMEGKQKNNE